MRRIFLALLLLAVPFPARAQTSPVVREPRDCSLLAAATAATDQASDAIATSRFGRGAFWISWASLTGTLDAAVKVQVASSAGPPAAGEWVDKTGAVFVISSAGGAEEISITNLTEAWARLVYTANGVAGGTVTANCNLKSI